ncbi:complement C1s subcomponent-like [Xyrichtys novacula]|uniref:Complement C1s subcomponent-like n=1 Tax=Xyrichtys novacula TaxID=13765 RepID=A0AAV1FQ14_XYRNO|nr:complement C1s subcomponent-like [Xyrichtys novacula]
MMFPVSLLLLLLTYSAHATLLGWVESPGYPTRYLPHASMNWTRCAPKGHSISIRLIHLDLEDSQDCENDAVKVYSNGSLISVLCGKMDFEDLQASVNPSLVSSSGGCLSLSFHSDYSNTKRHAGFRGFYSDQDFNECDDPDNSCTQFCHNFIGGYYCSCRHGYHLAADKHTCTVSCSKDLSGQRRGEVSSPSWPAPYAENSHCVYTLSVEEHLQIELLFSEDFDVEQSPDGSQCIDTVRVETSSETLGSFCGETPPPSPFLTHSHQVQIHFTSDGFGTNKGFSLKFKTRAKVCLAEVTPHSTATPQQPVYPQGQTVTVTCEVGYVVDTQGTTAVTREYETTCRSTGQWTPKYPCEPVDCGPPGIPEDGILTFVGSETQYNNQIKFNCSSKYYKLEGDDTYTCNANGVWESSRGKTEIPKCVAVCGMPDRHTASAGRILGGQDANVGEIPWHLLITEPARGGASLINDRWAVTAAHVVEGVQVMSLKMYGGVVSGAALTSNRAQINADRIIIHPSFITGVQDRTNFDNDIALIRLASRVNLSPNLLPVCLPGTHRGLLAQEQGTVSGWGVTDAPRGYRVSDTLKYADIGAYATAECQNTPTAKNNKRTVFTNNMFCAGAQGKDSCLKDSGGPFVVPVLSAGGPHYLAGIVSWGPPCRQRQYKGYYTKVENYVDWIRETMDANETS